MTEARPSLKNLSSSLKFSTRRQEPGFCIITQTLWNNQIAKIKFISCSEEKTFVRQNRNKKEFNQYYSMSFLSLFLLMIVSYSQNAPRKKTISFINKQNMEFFYTKNSLNSYFSSFRSELIETFISLIVNYRFICAIKLFSS